MKSRTDLAVLYAELHRLTESECASCPIQEPYSCCRLEYCALAILYAAKQGIDLPTTGHPTLPLMDVDGCSVPPHLRPLCTLHTCEVALYGEKRGDPEWTRRYRELRSELERLEAMA